MQIVCSPVLRRKQISNKVCVVFQHFAQQIVLVKEYLQFNIFTKNILARLLKNTQ